MKQASTTSDAKDDGLMELEFVLSKLREGLDDDWLGVFYTATHLHDPGSEPFSEKDCRDFFEKHGGLVEDLINQLRMRKQLFYEQAFEVALDFEGAFDTLKSSVKSLPQWLSDVPANHGPQYFSNALRALFNPAFDIHQGDDQDSVVKPHEISPMVRVLIRYYNADFSIKGDNNYILFWNKVMEFSMKRSRGRHPENNPYLELIDKYKKDGPINPAQARQFTHEAFRVYKAACEKREFGLGPVPDYVSVFRRIRVGPNRGPAGLEELFNEVDSHPDKNFVDYLYYPVVDDFENSLPPGYSEFLKKHMDNGDIARIVEQLRERKQLIFQDVLEQGAQDEQRFWQGDILFLDALLLLVNGRYNIYQIPREDNPKRTYTVQIIVAPFLSDPYALPEPGVSILNRENCDALKKQMLGYIHKYTKTIYSPLNDADNMPAEKFVEEAFRLLEKNHGSFIPGDYLVKELRAA